MIKTLIIEDEPLVAKDLKNQLKTLNEEIEIITTLGSTAEAIAWFQSNPQPDLIFMDIQLSDGVSFDILKEVTITAPIIFTTAYDQYAIQAFKHNSIDYLLKPIDAEELQHALDQFKLYTSENSDFSVKLKGLLSNLNQGGGKYKERFMVQTRNTLMPVPIGDIAYFSKEELIYIYTKENNRYLSENHSMEEIEEMCDPKQFYRANRQAIINVAMIERVKSSYNGKLLAVLKPPFAMEIDISREKASDFKEWLDS
ncbi:MAG: LytTR family DNA-binding domain-containing protein [Bacteroidota bacterium]|nr:LytTR family DNA-binding domain-containing protein [Bacteroidota bacterium]